jgi:hypothetical protein
MVGATTSDLLVCSPFVGAEPCGAIGRNLAQSAKLTLVTNLGRDNLVSGSTDALAIANLCESRSNSEILFLPGLHAKVYVSDDREAVVTSANLTTGGLRRNVEYGVRVLDGECVGHIRTDMLEFGRLGTRMTTAELRRLGEIAAELRDIQRDAEKSVRASTRAEFARRVAEVDDEVLRMRAAGRAPHAIFADAILHLLSHGPSTTELLHQQIRGIHPDLCDDTVDRVIDGKRFGKKWKHAVRTAQQDLKKRGLVEYADGLWKLRGSPARSARSRT